MGQVFVLALLPALISVVGCGESRLPVFPVSGKVTFEGKPPVGAQIVLYPVGSSETNEVVPSGTVKGDGTFTLTLYDPDDGAPPGDYVATIVWHKIDPRSGGPGPNVIPEKYTRATTSPVKVNVGGGPTQIPPIAISKH